MSKKTWLVILATAGAVVEAIRQALSGKKGV
jgi:hypothetical protein